MLERIQRNRNSHSLLVRMQNGTVILENSLVVSYKVKPLAMFIIAFFTATKNLTLRWPFIGQ